MTTIDETPAATTTARARATPALEAVLYTAGHGAATVAGSVAGLAARFFVAPVAFGALGVAQAAAALLAPVGSVLRNAVEREYPARAAVGDLEGARRVEAHANGALLVVVIAQALGFLVAGLVVDEALLRWALLLVGGMGIVDAFALSFAISLKARLRFREGAIAQASASVGRAALVIALAWAWGAAGYFIALLVGSTGTLLVLRRGLRDAPPGLHVPRTAAALTPIVGVGLALALLNFSRQLLTYADRFVVARYLSLDELGKYTLATTLVATTTMLASAVTGSYFPRMMSHFEAGRLEEARAAARSLQTWATALLFVALGLGVVVLEPVIRWALPAYSDAVPPLEILMIGGLAVGSQGAAVQVLVGRKRILPAILPALACAVVAVPLEIALARAYGLVGVAAGTTVALAAYTLTLNLVADSAFRSLVMTPAWIAGGVAMTLLVAFAARMDALTSAVLWAGLAGAGIASAWLYVGSPLLIKR